MSGSARRHRGARGAADCQLAIAALLTAHVWLCAGEPASAIAGSVSWVVAERSDNEIRDLVTNSLTFPAPLTAVSDAAAIVLLDEQHVRARRGSYKICRNVILRVVDRERFDGSTQRLQYGPDVVVESARGWLLRDGAVLRLERERVRMVGGTAGVPSGVVIAFPDVRAGDVMGWSVVESSDEPLLARFFELKQRYPVCRAEVRVWTDGDVVYRVSGDNLPQDRLYTATLARKHGAVSDIRLAVVDIPPTADEPYAPPALLAEPYLVADYRGTFDPDANRWSYLTCWNEVAAAFDGVLKSITKDDKDISRTARDLTRHANTPLGKADALYRFVCTGITQVQPLHPSILSIAARVTLRTRLAIDRHGQAILMYALCRASGLQARLLFARSREVGEFADDYPSITQFSDSVVEVNGGDGSNRIYAPAYRECPPGALPVELRGARAFAPEPDLEKKVRELGLEAFKATGGSPRRYADAWDEAVRKKHWCTFLTLPGESSERCATTVEEVSWRAGDDTLRVRLWADALTDVASARGVAEDATACVRDYLRARFPIADVVEASERKDHIASEAASCSLTACVRLRVSVPAEGDVWSIPASHVFGVCFLPDWQSPRRGPFYVRMSEALRRIWRFQLPEGWLPASLAAPVTVRNPRFDYRADIRLVDGELIVRRHYDLKQGITGLADLPALESAIRTVQDFEKRPIVLVKRETTEGQK